MWARYKEKFMIIRNLRFAPLLLLASFTGALWSQAATPGRFYDPSTETTLQGIISSVSTVTGRHGWNGLHLALQDGVCDVHLGPAAYVAARGFSFSAGDRIDIIASKVKVNGTDTCIARQITKEGKVLVLRDQQGFPMWSGARWKQP